MPGRSPDTAQLQGLLQRIDAGDPSARDELMRGLLTRLEQLARRMLRGYPAVRRWEDTGDVLQGSVVRLLRALEGVRPESTRALLGLAALQIRSDLLNLARYHRARPGRDAPEETGPAAEEGTPEEHVLDPASDARDLDKWTAFHEGVEALPEEEREAVSLV
jgi:RNA polymerase sigma-70 factor (ECF subfamily)